KILETTSNQLADALRHAQPQINAAGRGVVGDAARIRLLNPADMPRAMTAIRNGVPNVSQSGATQFVYTQTPDGAIEARLTPDYLREVSIEGVQHAIEIIRKRIDPNGTSEVTILRQGNNRIVVQAPGVDDPEELKSRIGQTAEMTFQLVDD